MVPTLKHFNYTPEAPKRFLDLNPGSPAPQVSRKYYIEWLNKRGDFLEYVESKWCNPNTAKTMILVFYNYIKTK